MEKKTYLYFPINKCASTTFRSVFKKYNHILVPNLNLNNDPDNNLHLLKPNYNLYYKFTIVRHPIDRFLSAVNMFIMRKTLKQCAIADGASRRSLNLITIIETAIDDTIKIMKTHDTYSLYRSRKDFIKRHTLPLTHNLYCLIDENNKLIVDLVIKLESLNDKKNVEMFFNKIKINPNTIIPTKNKSPKYIKFSDLTEDNLKFLYSYYENDFKFFDYE